MFLLLLSLFLACSSFNPEQVLAAAKTHITTLYPTKVAGPLCMPEPVSGDSTYCSFSYKDKDGIIQPETLLCSAKGCIPADKAVVAISATQGADFTTTDALMWYMLASSGRSTTSYNYWYTNTPSYGRSSYYGYSSTGTYTAPSTTSKTYYSNQYSSTKGLYSSSTKTVSTTNYATPRSSSTATQSTTTAKPTTSKSTSTATGTSTKRSSGFGTGGSTKRTSGFSSGGRRR